MGLAPASRVPRLAALSDGLSEAVARPLRSLRLTGSVRSLLSCLAPLAYRLAPGRSSRPLGAPSELVTPPCGVTCSSGVEAGGC